MKNILIPLVLAFAGSAATAAPASVDELNKMARRFAPVELKADASRLSAGDRQAIVKLIEAAKVIDVLQLRQRWEGNEALWLALRKDATPLGKARLDYFWLNKGPWSILDGNVSFLPPEVAGIKHRHPDAACHHRESCEAVAHDDGEQGHAAAVHGHRHQLPVHIDVGSADVRHGLAHAGLGEQQAKHGQHVRQHDGPAHGVHQAALLARGLRLSQFDIGRLQITDRRPPSPVEPLQPITLPVAITLPWSVGELVLDGKQELSLSGLKGQYRYRPADSLWNLGVADAHQLDLESLQVAGGRYQGQAVLGAQAPMPLRVDAQGEVKTTVPGGEDLVLKAIAKVTGQLAESDAALDATASLTTITSDTPVLDASARIRPWKT
eukprot:gene26542-29989_t